MRNVIVVGCGEQYRQNTAPTLAWMESAGEIKVIATVDLKPMQAPLHRDGPTALHLVRAPGQPLADCLKSFRHDDPVVYLAHSHSCHVSDTFNLVEDGFSVVLEKPYAILPADLQRLGALVKAHPRQVALAEYYLMMKSAPLLCAAGLLQPESFYFREPGYLAAPGETRVEDAYGILQRIGRPRMLMADVLEGGGATGRFQHRGRQFADSTEGIGVLLDLALHALAPIFALEELVGVVPPEREVAASTAVCDAFVRFADIRYRVPPQRVPETYAELAFRTSTGVQVLVAAGKYVLPNQNQRRLILIGDEGVAILDFSSCKLSLALRDQCPIPLLHAPKQTETKYVAVLKACLAQLTGDSPYCFDPADIALRANVLASNLYLREMLNARARPLYCWGALPGSIFRPATSQPFVVSSAA